MRQYECVCMRCGVKRQHLFHAEPYPALGDVVTFECTVCHEEAPHTRTPTRRAMTELRRQQQEVALKASIAERCETYGFKCRFLYRSVIITTSLADWCFDYHESRVTLYHESTVKVNYATGDYAKAHVQFANRKLKPLAVIDYIATHDAWRAAQATPPAN